MEIKGNFLNLRKNSYVNSLTNHILNGEIMNVFLLRSGTRQRCLLLLLFKMVLAVQASIAMQVKEEKLIQFGKKEVNLVLFTDDIIFYLNKIPRKL